MKGSVAIIGSDSFLSGYVYEKLSLKYEITGYSRDNRTGIASHILFDFPNVTLNLSELLDFKFIIYCVGNGVQSGTVNDLVYSVNCFIPIQIANYLNVNNYRGCLITFGTYFEIGNNSNEKFFTEEDVLTSIASVPNSYCSSKRLLTHFFNSESLRFNHYHLILPTVYGERENSNRLIPYIISSLQKKQEPLVTNGSQTRQYIHASDLANLILKITESDIAPGIYNIPCSETLTVKEIVIAIYEELEVDKKPLWNTSYRYDESMKFLALDGIKLKSLIPSWEASHSIKNSITSYNLN